VEIVDNWVLASIFKETTSVKVVHTSVNKSVDNYVACGEDFLVTQVNAQLFRV
jgi:dTDP-D-glucose 4,6-dehydratase